LAAPAFAHVTTDPSSAPQGGEITLGFRVPNEVAGANVVRVDLQIPTNPPLLGIDTEPVYGWTSTVTQVTLNPPVQTDDGPVTQAVNEISWVAPSGGGTPPGSFQEFYILVQQLPTNATQVVFKAVQTYSNGDVVRWIDPVVAGQPDPDHPTPILTLVPAGGTGTTATTTATTAPATSSGGSGVDLSKLAPKSSVSSAKTVGVIGILVGVLGLIVALVAITRRPRSGGEAPAASDAPEAA
jgi:periplasmic copper chaperone A